MKGSPDSNDDEKSVGPPAWLMATQWGMQLVALTCIFGFGGYYLGEHFLGGSFASIALMLLGLTGGMAMGLYRIFKASEDMDGTTKAQSRATADKSSDRQSDSDDDSSSSEDTFT